VALSSKLAAGIVRLRWLWIILSLLLVLGFGAGLKNIALDPDARIFFAEENPDRIALDQFEAEFAKDDNLILVLEPKGGER